MYVHEIHPRDITIQAYHDDHISNMFMPKMKLLQATQVPINMLRVSQSMTPTCKTTFRVLRDRKLLNKGARSGGP